jgi:hypothetical protein
MIEVNRKILILLGYWFEVLVNRYKNEDKYKLIVNMKGDDIEENSAEVTIHKLGLDMEKAMKKVQNKLGINLNEKMKI